MTGPLPRPVELLRGGMELGDLKASDTIFAVILYLLCKVYGCWDLKIKYRPFMVDSLPGADGGGSNGRWRRLHCGDYIALIQPNHRDTSACSLLLSIPISKAALVLAGGRLMPRQRYVYELPKVYPIAQEHF